MPEVQITSSFIAFWEYWIHIQLVTFNMGQWLNFIQQPSELCIVGTTVVNLTAMQRIFSYSYFKLHKNQL